MKSLNYGRFVVVLFLITGISTLLLAYSDAALAEKQPALKNEDCVKCHAGPQADIATGGGKHKSIGCTGCHVGHPPAMKDNIPKCSMCHGGNPHFELKGCLDCHKNPHTPLKISFRANVTEPCLTCHTNQIKELREYKSKHSALGCSTCHTVHRKIPECLQCHKPHAADMTAAECKKCHKPHMPTVLTYTDGIQSKECGACHRKAFDILRDSKSKHKYLTCVFCHKEKHKMIPRCLDCHSSFHQKAGLTHKFPTSLTSWVCRDCHNIAHDLNNWPEVK
jgi:hypothetical protein